VRIKEFTPLVSGQVLLHRYSTPYSIDFETEARDSLRSRGHPTMRFAHISVSNFKALMDVRLPASRFVCVIGENNSGKSSLLQALLFFVDGKKIDQSLFFDTQKTISIAVRIDDISETDLSLLTNEEHRKRFTSILENKSVTLVRKYETTGMSRLQWIDRVPTDPRFDSEQIEALVSGQKPGAAFADSISTTFPELQAQVNSKTNQTQVKQLIQELADKIPDSQKKSQEADLPAGFDNTIKPLLPEPIYIPAVKDLADDIATKDSASFGRLLGILLNLIAPDLQDADETFKILNTKLNKTKSEAGELVDERLTAVKTIESLVQSHVQENFPKVEIDFRIPPPEMKTVLSGAQIWVNDGISQLIESKGDGLKRAVTFSILRSFVELRRSQKVGDATHSRPQNYLFLFEEPELYLHPTAQKILFDALSEISKSHHVFVTTHSPLFFNADATGTFIKLAKRSEHAIAPRPFSEAKAIDLADIDAKSKFQIISYETNNHAFFSRLVILVEGDSDVLVVPHIARLLDSTWSPEATGAGFCRIGGKGNIAKYKEFFTNFGVRTCIITDLDCLLDGYEHLGASTECDQLRQELIVLLDATAEEEGVQGKPNSKKIKDLQTSQTKKQQFSALVTKITEYRAGTATEAELRAVGDTFFSEVVESKRRQVLEESTKPEIIAQKKRLLRELRNDQVYVLAKGSIEAYYPENLAGNDKPTKAMEFCKTVKTKELLLTLCDDALCEDGTEEKELLVMFRAIFGV
jgi:putative ATP-dependent endonuclease of OLD family